MPTQRHPGDRRRAAARRSCTAWSVILGLLLTACSATPRTPPRNQPLITPVLSASYVLAPVRGDAEIELTELAGVRTTPARLRRGWILVQRGRPQEALDTVAEVLWGPEKPSPAAEAWARYLRSEAFTAMGQPERGGFDRERALALALDPELRRRLPAPAATAKEADTAAPPAAAVAIQRRAAWNPTPAIAGRMKPMGRIYRMTVHHSALYFRDTSAATCAAQLRVIQRDHMQGREYGDVGYHYLIDPAGRVWEGRDIRWQGAHARDENNVGNIGICLLGRFVRDRTGQRPSDAQVAALGNLLRDLSNRYQIGGNSLYCHRDFVQTECPGPNLVPVVKRLADELRAAPKGPGTRVAAR